MVRTRFCRSYLQRLKHLPCPSRISYSKVSYTERSLHAWEDEQVHKFLPVLPELTGAKKVTISNNYYDKKVSNEALVQLKAACEARGNSLYRSPEA